MRINEIAVTRLFGLFDHAVSMKMSDRVTIITGPNGYGKTTLLRLVDGVMSGRYSEVRKVSFRDFQIGFDDGHVLQVIRVDARTQTRQPAAPDLAITLLRGQKKVEHTILPALPIEHLGISPSMISRMIPALIQTGPTQWRDARSGEEVSIEEILRMHPEFFPIPIERISTFAEPKWLGEFRKTATVRFIEVQRLLRVGKAGGHREDDDEPVKPSVMVYSRELAKLIKSKLAEYATLSQSLDRSFPKRLVDQTHSRKAADSRSVEDLLNRLQQLENRRTSLTEAGLLDKDYEHFDLPNNLTDPTLTGSVLPIYAQDAEQKLKVFDDIAPKIELLTGIINTHFRFKELHIDKERGFQFMTNYPGPSSRPRPLSTSQLSSGEQHMLVLLYELLFTVAPNSLIMIDEPEISLHVEWQLGFLSDIQKITALTGIDVLLATHAPGIINDRRDLTVALEGPLE